MYRNKQSDIPYIIAIIISCVIAWWPVSFSIYSLKNDALNYFLPVRYQISEALYNGHLPLWSPYFNLGYPLHGDMQSGAWNPFVWIFSLAGPYTLQTLQYETLFYVIVSGIGMFYLCRHFIDHKPICLFAAIAYMLCGYNSDSAQFLNWISSASFIPFVFLYYYRLLSESSLRTALLAGLFLFLLFVTAYPADFIIMCYLLAGTLLWSFISNKMYKNKRWLSTQIKLHFVFIISFLLLSLPAIISYAQFLPLTERGSGASYADVMSNPYHPFLLFSYVTPLGVWRAPQVSITDPLERNSFIGIITFFFLLLILFQKQRNNFIRFCKWGFIIFLIFSFGEFGGLRILTYYLLPLMDTFRHPANAKIFTTFFGCLLAAFSIYSVVKADFAFSKKQFLLSSCVIFILFATAIVWSLSHSLPNLANLLWNSNTSELKALLDNLNFPDLIILNTLLQIPFLLLLILWIRKRFHIQLLITAGIINCIIHTALFQPFTVVKKDKVSSIQQLLNTIQVKGYPLPNPSFTIADNSKNGDSLFDEIGTLNMYNKKIGRVDYRITPSNLLTQNEFWFNETLRNHILQLPLLYKADTALFVSDSMLFPAISKATLLEDRSMIEKINQTERSHHSASFTYFTPNQFTFTNNSATPGFYTFFQNMYPRWELYINGVLTKPIKSNISFIGFWLPGGTHEITMKYRSIDLKIAGLICILTLIFILIVVLKPSSFKSSYPSLQ